LITMEVDLYDVDLDIVESEVSEDELNYVDNFGIELDDEQRLRAAFWIKRQLDKENARLTVGDRITMTVTVTSIGRMLGIKDNVTGEEATVTDLSKL